VEVRDLGSRNGTTVEGIPVGDRTTLEGPCVLGLGDDVKIRVAREEGALSMRVEAGVDRGLHARASEGPLRLEGVPARVEFPDGWATLVADAGAPLLLQGQPCAAPVELLIGDRLIVGGVGVEVRA